MWLPLAVAVLGGNLVIPVADNIPNIDVRPSCRAISSGISVLGRDYDSCMKSEQQAKNQMQKEWPEFTSAERGRCINASTTGGEATYTEALTCLEMARDVRKMPPENALETTGTGTGKRGAPQQR